MDGQRRLSAAWCIDLPVWCCRLLNKGSSRHGLLGECTSPFHRPGLCPHVKQDERFVTGRLSVLRHQYTALQLLLSSVIKHRSNTECVV